MALSRYLAYFTVPVPQPHMESLLDTFGLPLPWLDPDQQQDSSPIEVIHWADRVHVNAYLLVEDVAEWEVVRVEWWKYLRELQHEFLVLHLQRTGSEGSHTRRLRLDRRPQTHEDLRFATTNLTQSVHGRGRRKKLGAALRQEHNRLATQGARVLGQRFSDSAVTIKAWDTVVETVSETGQLVDDPQPPQLVAAYSNFAEHLTLPEAARCAAIVSMRAPNYHVLLDQCYWFCRTIAGVIVFNYGPSQEDHGEAFDNRGKFVWGRAEWGSLTLNKDAAGEIELLARRLSEVVEKDSLSFKRKQERERQVCEENVQRLLVTVKEELQIEREADREERRQERQGDKEERRREREEDKEERRLEREAEAQRRREHEAALGTWDRRLKEDREERRLEREAEAQRRREHEAALGTWLQGLQEDREERCQEREVDKEERRQHRVAMQVCLFLMFAAISFIVLHIQH
ncbi:unnamed protein product [Cyclocybe aegerita]|uniref:Uncharacterized protein n=1 Tax=Cyclocybe aegerita TaxID=1973307 RepID=A0A8S0XIR2_CYCAE|nr:unnamed protein product [Cyclocybe aegerita]